MKQFILPVTAGVLLLCAAGCGDGKKEKSKSLAERSGEKFGRSAREFAVAVGKGVDDVRTKPVVVVPELKARGIDFTVSKETNVITQGNPALVLYLVAEKDFNDPIVARALNSRGQEIGRAHATLAVKADEAKYITLEFPKEMEAASVESYEIREGKK